MDEKPFFEFNMLDFNESTINEIKRFSKLTFNPEEMGDVARNLLYTTEIKRLMAEQLTDPSPDFVKFFADQVYTGQLVASVVEKFTEITKRSLKEFINDRITDRLKSAIDLPDTATAVSTSAEVQEIETETNSSFSEDQIVTTEEEIKGFYIIKAVIREVVDVGRIQFKDTKSYFGINIDGKVSKTICRLWLNSNKKTIAIVDVEGKEAKKTISSLDEIYGLAGILKDRAKYLIHEGAVKNSPKVEKVDS